MMVSKEGSRKLLGLLLSLILIAALTATGKLTDASAMAVATLYGLFVAGNGAEYLGKTLGGARRPMLADLPQAIEVAVAPDPGPTEVEKLGARVAAIEGAVTSMAKTTREISEVVTNVVAGGR